MAVIVYTDASVSIEGTNISNRVASVALTYEAEPLDATAMGDQTRGSVLGLLNWSIEMEVFQDHSSGGLDSLFWSWVTDRVQLTIVIKPTSAAVGTSNPSFTGEAYLTGYSPITGSVGELGRQTINFVPAKGAATLTRATA